MITEHVYEKWRTYNREYLEKCRRKYVAVTFSAGKDSSACLYLLHRVREEYGFDIGGFLYAFPKHRYTSEFREKLLPFWNNLGISIEYREAEEEDSILEETENPCRPCQDLRKKLLPEIFPHLSKPLEQVVIVSGHSLWDLAGYALDRFVAKHLASSTSYTESFSDDRLLEISQRFYPFLSMKEGYSVYRPMLFLNSQEIEQLCEEKSLPLLPIRCRYSHKRPKKLLGNYFESFGYQFEYERVLAFAKEHIKIAGLEEIQKISREEYLTKRF
ncbi:MAG: hypothetical protein JW852_11135 [Spirochaetales bacterium]|nr:hypothetical protein [Spirochaetales bacterium]